MKLINYKQYCNEVFLTEEKLKDVVERLKIAFPEEAELRTYIEILDLFPSLPAKSLITTFLIRTKEERKKTNLSGPDTKQIFEQFIGLLRRNVKIDLADLMKQDKIKHPESHGSNLFTEFTELIHFQIGRIEALAQKKMQKAGVGGLGGETIDTKYPDPVYVDNNFEVYEAKSPAECEGYMGDSSICLKWPVHFWGSYRIPYASAVYYIFPRSPKTSFNNHRFLQIELRAKGDLVWTWEDNRMNHLASLAELKAKFPEITTLIEKKVFKPRPHAPGETENFQRVQNKLDDENFRHLGYEVRTMYISNGHELTDNQWKMIDKNQKNAYINFSLNRDISPFQFKELENDEPTLFRRYLLIKKRGLENKIKSGEFAKKGLTPHESVVLPELLNNVSEDTKNSIIKGLIKNIKEILAGKLSPKTDISNLYQMFKPQLLADPSMKDDEIVTSISNILAGGKSFDWKDVPDKVKQGIYGIAKDIYDTEEEKMAPLVQQKLKANPDLLIQGLITVPTPFQIDFFNRNEKQLMDDSKFNHTLTQNVLSHLSYGTELPPWLKEFWNSRKEFYLKDGKFASRLKYDLQIAIFGHENPASATKSSVFPQFNTLTPETQEIYKKFINEIWKDPKTQEIVDNNVYDQVLNKNHNNNLNDIDSWNVSDEFKKYVKEHLEHIKSHFTFRVLDAPPEHMRPDIAEVVNAYKDRVFKQFREQIETSLMRDIVEQNKSFKWDADRIRYWMENFWDILNRHPGMEEKLLNKVIEEYGFGSMATGFYTEYGIPLEFYKKYEKQILGNEDAREGLIKKIVTALVWRVNKNESDEDAVQNTLSPIERDYLFNHKKDFPAKLISPNNRGGG